MSMQSFTPPPRRAGRGLARSVARTGAATLLALLARPVAAQTDYYNTDAGRPLTIEDAYPVERRALELQLAPLRLERARGGVYQWGLEPELAFGVLPRTQVEVGFPMAVVDAGRGRRVAGLAGVELSALHNLNVETTTLPALGVAADLLLPAGGLGPTRAYPSFKGIATRTFPWARFHLNGQLTLGDELADDPDGVDAGTVELSRWQAGVAVDRTFPLRSLLVSGELVARQPLQRESDLAWSTAAGLRYQLSPRVAGDAGAGYRLTGGDEGWYATIGAAVVVGLPWRAR
jgi:hypothetical protein